ncbi:MAG: hypothetical protein Q7R79_01190 [bacterium]|nr:hypothetical protein [bacterium]
MTDLRGGYQGGGTQEAPHYPQRIGWQPKIIDVGADGMQISLQSTIQLTEGESAINGDLRIVSAKGVLNVQQVDPDGTLIKTLHSATEIEVQLGEDEENTVIYQAIP